MGCDLPAEPQMEFVRKALGFLENGQISCPSFFCILGIVQKRQKFCGCFTKQQNFTQRIAAVVALCYNEQRRRMNCA